MNQNLVATLRMAGLTFAGALLGALGTGSIPTTVMEAKAVLLPALGAAVAAELVFVRAQVAAALASAPSPAAPTPAVKQ